MSTQSLCPMRHFLTSNLFSKKTLLQMIAKFQVDAALTKQSTNFVGLLELCDATPLLFHSKTPFY